MIANVVVLGLPYHIKSVYSYTVPECDDPETLIGRRVRARFGRLDKYGVIISISNGVPKGDSGFEIVPVDKILDERPVLTGELLSLAEWMASFYASSLSECLSLITPNPDDEYKRRPPKKTKDSGTDAPSSAFESNASNLAPNASDGVKLNAQQQQAFDRIGAGIRENKPRMLYLRGVTGSGKTEVLLRAAKMTVDSGFSVLYLVPEIALTDQLGRAVLDMFGERQARIVHSGVTRKRRADTYMRCLEGEVRMILGTRSAVFSPLRDLRLIIVDEEQDQSYKDGKSPRFHVRQIAQWRSSRNSSLLCMASATPSLESLNAVRSGRMDILRLTSRISASRLPQIITIPMKRSDDIISDELHEMMKLEIDSGRGVILFLNRRGYLYHYKCQTCGYEKTCPDCSVSMTYHRSGNVFRCHRCGKESAYFTKCPECGSANEMYSGYGTEYVEKVVKNLFPFSCVRRMDSDTASAKEDRERMIRDFEDGKINALIGTQMISKGFNFKNLRLVGVINASQNPVSADFRQDEKLFSLLVQVAGRSGRFSKDGKVVIQTESSAREIAAYVKSGRDDDFYESELSLRKALSLPPFCRMARIVVKGEDEAMIKKVFSEISFLLHRMISDVNARFGKDSVQVTHEGQCPIFKEAGKFRFQFIIKSPRAEHLTLTLDAIRDSICYKRFFKVEFDMDPMDFM